MTKRKVIGISIIVLFLIVVILSAIILLRTTKTTTIYFRHQKARFLPPMPKYTYNEWHGQNDGGSYRYLLHHTRTWFPPVQKPPKWSDYPDYVIQKIRRKTDADIQTRVTEFNRAVQEACEKRSDAEFEKAEIVSGLLRKDTIKFFFRKK